MLCDDCQKRPARVRITQIVNNQKQEKRLCEECAQAAGEGVFDFNNQFSVHDLLKGMLNHSLFGEIQSKNELACEQCGMTYSDFNRLGKFGCSNCYSTFSKKLEPLLRRIHGATHHTGKLPKRTGGLLEVKQTVKRMRQELEQYVLQEEYEKAAQIRDEIRRLEREVSEQERGGV
jgi:protein arginine kinase activator